MAKAKSVYFCQECGYESAKWLGQCPACKAWNSMVEEKVTTKVNKSSSAGSSLTKATPKKLSTVTFQEDERILTGIGELDRVLGGGIVKGSLVLVGGDPGIGKSTLLLQMCRCLSGRLKDTNMIDNVSNTSVKSVTGAGIDGSRGALESSGESKAHLLYVSGEESLKQIKMRADRIGDFADDMWMLCETNLNDVEQTILNLRPEVVVIDSIQTMFSENIDSAPGSVSQVRETTSVLMKLAKQEGITIFIVGHVTKEGVVAGPRVLEHMVDTVLYFEGDRHASYRLLRAVKNRFGSTNEVGVFEMRSSGLEEVLNPSEYMLNGMPDGASGSIVSCAMEGTRPILVEIQALVSQTNFNMPRRTAAGTDYNRVNLLMAVLEKRLGLQLGGCDAYVNIAGGMKLNEPAIDLAIVTALISSYKNRPVSEKTIIFGEVGLTGEVRAVNMAQQRVNEAAKLGFKFCLVPKMNIKNIEAPASITLIGIESVRDILKYIQ